MSVVEFSVAMTIGAVLLAASAAAFVGAMRTVHSVNASTSTVADTRLAMEAVTRTLRVAYKPTGQAGNPPAAVVSAGPNSVSFWALLNRTGAATVTAPPPTLVTYAWNGNCLNETQQPLGGTATTKCLVRTSANPSANPSMTTFTYFSSGAETLNGATVAPLTTPLDLTAIRSVQVSLTVQTPGDPAASALPVISRVTLQNIPPAGG